MKRVAIIGGGISGLTALHFLRQKHAEAFAVTLYEKDDRLGGTIGTDRDSGFISDWGPNGFLDKVPLTLRVVRELGLDNLLEPAAPGAEKRFIYRNNILNEISASPLKFLRSSLLSIPGRMRLLSEPFISQKKDERDESVFDFAVRRIGREAAENMIVPMVSGIFGGDARQLSLKACFPVMVEMEKNYGSLFKALIAKKRAGKKASAAGPSGRLTSFANGLYTLIEFIQNKYKDHIQTGTEVVGVDKNDTGYNLYFRQGRPEKYDAVICAAPAYAAVQIFSIMDGELGQLLSTFPYASISVVCSGYRREVIRHNLAGFGFLVPRNQGKRMLGSIWTSSIFKGRSPEGMVQFRSMVGGATDPEAIALSETELVKLVHDELKSIVGIENKPAYTRIFKYERGIPQFVLGHPDKMSRLERLLKSHPDLYFTGNAYEGVGLNDCVIRSDKVVNQLAKRAFTPAH